MGDAIVLLGPLVMISAMSAGIYIVFIQVNSTLSRIASTLERLEEKT